MPKCRKSALYHLDRLNSCDAEVGEEILFRANKLRGEGRLCDGQKQRRVQFLQLHAQTALEVSDALLRQHRTARYVQSSPARTKAEAKQINLTRISRVDITAETLSNTETYGKQCNSSKPAQTSLSRQQDIRPATNHKLAGPAPRRLPGTTCPFVSIHMNSGRTG